MACEGWGTRGDQTLGRNTEYTFQDYRLRHVATVKAVENVKIEQERKAAEETGQRLLIVGHTNIIFECGEQRVIDR